MSSIQERLQLKRIPLDTWSIREQLCLASAVVRSGDQNWMSVSRSLKTVGDSNRPPDWYSQKSCAAQYGVLLEHVETPKRKKRCTEGAGVVETPQESIVKRLTHERITEIQKTIAEMKQQYEKLQKDVHEICDTNTSDQRIDEMWAEVEAAKRAREKETAKRAAWLKEREERRALAERTWRPAPVPITSTPGPAPQQVPTPASPLLTSLLKSSPVITTPQHISHPANAIETVSPSAGAPTLSMLLERREPAQDASRAAIEHIKSQLVQIEHQLKANTSTPPAVPLAPPAVDIDDIEIKAEDVYAFRDIDIQIPPVATIHKPNIRTSEPGYYKKEVDTIEVTDADSSEEQIQESTHVKQTTEEGTENASASADVELSEQTTVTEETPSQEHIAAEPLKICFPEVKFPTPEIKVITSDDEKIRDENKESEVAVVKEKCENVTENEMQDIEAVPTDSLPKDTEISSANSTGPVEDVSTFDTSSNIIEHTDSSSAHLTIAVEDIPLPPDPEPTVFEDKTIITDVSEIPMPPSPEPVNLDDTKEKQPEITEDLAEEIPESVETTTGDAETKIEREELKESSTIEEKSEEGQSTKVENVYIKEEKSEVEETHTETDDDTPMELIREEERGGKKKRDYSRKKKFELRTYSGSESAPDSPGPGDWDRQHRLWKKSVMLVYNRLCSHKNASLFLRPITDDEAPEYSAIVKKPMDLGTIKKNIDAGAIRSTTQFHRDVLLMLCNALIYNGSEHSVYKMAMEMYEEACCQLEMLVAAQAHAGLAPPPPTGRKRRRLRSPPSDA